MVPTLFLQIFVLGVCATGFVAVVINNGLHVKPPLRIGLGILIMCLAYFVAVKLQKLSSSQVPPPVASNATAKETSPPPPTTETAPPDQPTEKAAGGSGNVIPVSHSAANAASPQAATAESMEPTSNALRVEVLYDGPTAAGGVINPRDIMSKELSDAGLQVVLGGATLYQKPTREAAPAAPVPRTVMNVAPEPEQQNPQPTAGPSARPRMVLQSPSGLTVKEIFDFVRKAQQGEWMNGPGPAGGFLSFSTPLYAASPPVPGLVVVAMRASMQHLRETQGIFATEAHMEIAAVTSNGRSIQSVIMMAGPEMVRGFGLDWDRAEETALKDISAKMCPAFAKDLNQKLTGNK
jgi:hypothetical protein